jgi:PAS domain S-box-containing protein
MQFQSISESERFRLFVAGVTDYAIYMLSPEGIISTWNAGARLFKGYAPEEIIGQHFSRFYTSEDLAIGLPAHALKTALEQGKFEGEGWRVRKDGSRFWAHVVIDPIYDESGQLIGYAKITRDITEKKKATDALHASEERFRMLVQGVTDYAIYMLSPEGIITNWNGGAQRIKGFAQEEVVGTHFSRFYAEEDRLNGLPERALATARQAGRFEGEGWRIRKDGTRFWANVVIDPIHDDAGTLVGFAKVTRDITERRNAAEALERTKEALFQSQKLEAIGKLTGGVAHDFNNLLNVIVGGIDILSQEVRSPGGIRILDSMRRAAERGGTLTQQLLAFARKQPLKQEKQNINRVIGSFEAVLRRASTGVGNLDIQLAARLPAVTIDAAQFEAALLNLIVNARDATSESGRILLTTAVAELATGEINNLPAGRYVSISVEDTGTGMPPEVAARAIEPFFTTKEVGRGTGLGLSQVYGFVQQSGGDVAIYSQVGKGTNITLYLPALGEEVSEDVEASASAAEKALVVDDQPDVLDIAVEVFRNLGYDVLSANNGKDALNILERTPDIDVLFSDVVMPELNGIELAKRARVLNPGLKILLASGYTTPALKSENNDIEQFELISKPYRLSEIMKRLRVS